MIAEVNKLSTSLGGRLSAIKLQKYKLGQSAHVIMLLISYALKYSFIVQTWLKVFENAARSEMTTYINHVFKRVTEQTRSLIEQFTSHRENSNSAALSFSLSSYEQKLQSSLVV